MKSFGPFEAFLFDQDGTIIDSEHAHWEAWRNLAKRYNFTIPEEIVKKTQGTTDAIVAEELLQHIKTKKSIEEIVMEKKKEFEKLVLEISLMQGAEKILRQAKSQGKTALVTASPIKQTEEILENLRIKRYFDVIITRDHVKRNKPDPDIYYKAAEALKTAPDACCVFEDSDTGLLAAKNAQMFCVSIPNEIIKHRDYSKADVKVNSLNNINIKESKIWIEE
ncbi:HAD family phosphatase [Candidatus Woesearchaeota archaeon]|nr:HAD family phosphatase [Candidatus Woesearchaeota archaeon]